MSASRKDEILEAALGSFAATGGTAIEEVRKRSGASVGSIYHHFGGKDGIAAALYVQILRGYQEGVARALRRGGGGPGGGGGAGPPAPALGRGQPRAGALPAPERRRALRGGGGAEGAEPELLDRDHRVDRGGGRQSTGG